MRTIKFRGKRINRKGEWSYGDLRQDGHSCWVFPCDDTAACDRDLVDPETVGQYTGLEDKNGKEIYEGDILMFQNEVKRVVGYEDSHRACFSLLDQHLHYNASFGSGTYESFYCEVIGNIHDHPELINHNKEDQP